MATRRHLGLEEDAPSHYNLACAAAHLGQRERALVHLRRALELRFHFMGRRADGSTFEGKAGILEDPDTAPLHGDPEFEAIVGGDAARS
jgi:hypothetical protein